MYDAPLSSAVFQDGMTITGEFENADRQQTGELVTEERSAFKKRAASKNVMQHFQKIAEQVGGRNACGLNAKTTPQTALPIFRSRQAERMRDAPPGKGDKASGRAGLASDSAQGIGSAAISPSFLEEELDALCEAYERQMSHGSADGEDPEQTRQNLAESIQGGIDAAAVLRETPPGDSGLIDAFRATWQGAKQADDVSPLTLFESLVGKFGGDLFSQSMKALRLEIAASGRRHTAGDLGAGSMHAYLLGAAFHMIQSSESTASALRIDLSEEGFSVREKIRLVAAVLGLGEPSSASMDRLVDAAIDMPRDLPPGKEALLYRLMRDAIASLPITLWPPEKFAARTDLLEDARQRMQFACLRASKASGRGTEDRLERRLRSRIGRRKERDENESASG